MCGARARRALLVPRMRTMPTSLVGSHGNSGVVGLVLALAALSIEVSMAAGEVVFGGLVGMDLAVL